MKPLLDVLFIDLSGKISFLVAVVHWVLFSKLERLLTDTIKSSDGFNVNEFMEICHN